MGDVDLDKQLNWYVEERIRRNKAEIYKLEGEAISIIKRLNDLKSVPTVQKEAFDAMTRIGNTLFEEIG